MLYHKRIICSIIKEYKMGHWINRRVWKPVWGPVAIKIYPRGCHGPSWWGKCRRRCTRPPLRQTCSLSRCHRPRSRSCALNPLPCGSSPGFPHFCMLPTILKAAVLAHASRKPYWKSPSCEFLELSASVWIWSCLPQELILWGICFPTCKQSFWNMTSIHYIIFTQLTRQTFCSVIEVFSVEVLEFSLSLVEAQGSVCLPCVFPSYSHWLNPFLFVFCKLYWNHLFLPSSFSLFH